MTEGIQPPREESPRRRFSPLTWTLAGVLALGVLVPNLVLWRLAKGEYKETVLHHTRHYLRARGPAVSDSWKPMGIALEYAEKEHTVPLYSEIFLNRGVRFQYPPASLFVVKAARFLDRFWPLERISLLDAVSWVCVLFTALCVVLLLRRGVAASGGADLSPRNPADRCLQVFLVTALTLTFYPVLKAYTMGQIQAWINAGLALLALLWVSERKIAAGILTGLLCLLKPQYALIALWGLFRRQWRFTAAAAVTAGVGLLVSVAVFGVQDHLDYLNALSFMSRHGESYYPNQSVNGLLNRVWSVRFPDDYSNVRWQHGHFPPFNPWVYGGTLATSAALVFSALWRRRDSQNGGPLDLCVILLSATMASPIAWEHHYGILLPAYAFLLPAVLREARVGPRIALAAAYVLTANFWYVTARLASTPFNVAQSYVFVGALAVLWLLYRRCSGRPAGGSCRS